MDIRRFFRLPLFLASLGIAQFAGASTDTLIVEDLRHSWVFQDGTGTWKPVVDPAKSDVIVVPVISGKYSSSYIMVIESSKPIDVWINDRLWNIGTRRWVFQLDELFERSGHEEVFIQLASAGGFKTLTTNLVEVRAHETLSVDSDLLIKKSGNQFNNFLVIYLLIVLLYAAAFRRYFNVKFNQIIKWRPRMRKLDVDENFAGVLTIDNILTVFFIGLLTSFVWIYYRVVAASETALVTNLYQLWTAGMVAGLSYLVIKTILIRSFASIFNFRIISGIQLVEFLNYACAISIIVFLLVLIDYSLLDRSHWFISNGLVISLIVTILFFQPWIYMKFNRTVPNSKILIISYLCVTEFLPGFLLVVWIIR